MRGYSEDSKLSKNIVSSVVFISRNHGRNGGLQQVKCLEMCHVVSKAGNLCLGKTAGSFFFTFCLYSQQL